MWLLRFVWNRQTRRRSLSVWRVAACVELLPHPPPIPLPCAGLGLITVNRQPMVPPLLSPRPRDMNLCSPLFSCCIYEEKASSSWMYLERYLSLNESLFSFAEYVCWTNGNAQMSAIYVCLLSSVFPPHPPAFAPNCPVCVRVPNVIMWLKGKKISKGFVSRTQFVMFASFNGAIAVNFFFFFFFFLAVNVPSNDYMCDAKLTTPVALTVLAKLQFKVWVNFSTIFMIFCPKRTELWRWNWANTDPVNHMDVILSPSSSPEAPPTWPQPLPPPEE